MVQTNLSTLMAVDRYNARRWRSAPPGAFGIRSGDSQDALMPSLYMRWFLALSVTLWAASIAAATSPLDADIARRLSALERRMQGLQQKPKDGLFSALSPPSFPQNTHALPILAGQYWQGGSLS